MAEWLVHGTNYLFGRLDEPHLNLKEIVEEDEENGQRLDEIVDELEDAEDDYRFLNLPNSKRSSTHKSQHQENEVNIGTVKVESDSQIKSTHFLKSFSLTFPTSCNRKVRSCVFPFGHTNVKNKEFPDCAFH